MDNPDQTTVLPHRPQTQYAYAFRLWRVQENDSTIWHAALDPVIVRKIPLTRNPSPVISNRFPVISNQTSVPGPQSPFSPH